MHKSATKCNETLGKWCKNKHGASKIMDTLETYQSPSHLRALEASIRVSFLLAILDLRCTVMPPVEEQSYMTMGPPRAKTVEAHSGVDVSACRCSTKITDHTCRM
jgi:hypothetical protein